MTSRSAGRGGVGRLFLPLLVLATVLLASAAPALAANNCRWDPPGSGTYYWDDAANWSNCSSVVPTIADRADFNSGYSNVSCYVRTEVVVGRIYIYNGYTGTLRPDTLGTRSLTVVGTTGLAMHSGGTILKFRRITIAAGALDLDDDVMTAPASPVTFVAPDMLIVGTFFTVSGTVTFTGGTGTVVLAAVADQSNFKLDSSNDALYTLRVEDPTETGLVAYWKLDEAAGTTTDDWSGSANDGTLTNGPTWSTGAAPAVATTNFANPASVVFDGSNDYISLGTTNIPANNVSQTIAMWIYYTALPGTGKTFIETFNGSASGNRFGFSGTNMIQVWQDSGASKQLVGIAGAGYATSTWHHIAYTYDSVSATHSRLYVDGAEVDNDTTVGVSGAITSVRLGARSSGAEYFAGRIDDVRIYNVVLSAAQILALKNGGYAGTGGTATWTFDEPANAFGGSLSVDSGTLELTNAVTAGITTTVAGDVAVNAGATLKLTSINGMAAPTLQLANTKTLTVNGTLQTSVGTTAAKPIVKAGSGAYTFTVTGTGSGIPVLNIDGLDLQDVGTAGMNITSTSATTTFVSFKNIAFSSGTGTYALQITVPSLSSTFFQNLTFDNSTTKTFKLSDSDAGSDTRATVSGTCNGASTNCEGLDEDDDNDTVPNGLPDGTGTVIQWLHSGYTDLAGTIEGYPSVSFSWTSYLYHATFVAYNNVGGTADILYKRGDDGEVVASWTLPGDYDFVGSPRWTNPSGTTYYVYVVDKKGNVYMLDDALSVTPVDTFNDGAMATCTSPLAMDTTNLYWIGKSGANVTSVFSVTQATLTANMGSPLGVLAGTAVPALGVVGTTPYLYYATYSGGAGTFYKLPVSPLSAGTGNGSQPTAAVYGRVSVINNNTTAFFVDDKGKVFAIDTNSPTTTRWSYQISGHGTCTAGTTCSAKNLFYNYAQDRVYFGDYDGYLYAVQYSGVGTAGVVIDAQYPLLLEAGTNRFMTAPLYRTGVIAIGSTTGNVYFVNQTDGSGDPALIRTYKFGSAGISSISFDFSGSQYVVGTSDGKLYYIDQIADPGGAN